MSVDDYNPVCLHKEPEGRVVRTGICCPECGFIRHRHSYLALVPYRTIGGFNLLTREVVPLRALPDDPQVAEMVADPAAYFLRTREEARAEAREFVRKRQRRNDTPDSR